MRRHQLLEAGEGLSFGFDSDISNNDIPLLTMLQIALHSSTRKTKHRVAHTALYAQPTIIWTVTTIWEAHPMG